MNTLFPPSLLLATAVLMSACTKPTQTPAPPKASFLPTTSIQELMVSIVDPSADALWESVSVETTASGLVEKKPVTDKEWLAVRAHAIALLEAGNLLMIEGRPVTHDGKPTEDAAVAGVSTPQQIAQAIADWRPDFNARARAMQDAAGEAIAAIDARDSARLMDAGGRLDQACEHCHSVYWYPNAKGAPNRWPAPVKAP